MAAVEVEARSEAVARVGARPGQAQRARARMTLVGGHDRGPADGIVCRGRVATGGAVVGVTDGDGADGLEAAAGVVYPGARAELDAAQRYRSAGQADGGGRSARLPLDGRMSLLPQASRICT